MFYDVKERLSHSQWRKLVKKNQRKYRRQAVAKEKAAALVALQSSPSYEAKVRAEEAALAAQREKEELEHRILKAEFQARDLALHSLFLHHKAVREEIQLKARQRPPDKSEEPASVLQKRSSLQSSLLLQSSREALTQRSDRSHNPEPPQPPAPPAHQQMCPFFNKTGTCRFGSRCSRYHSYPTVSRTLLLPNLYMAPGELPDARHNSDAMLEYDEADRHQHFRDFFFDFTDEAKKFGTIAEVRVCANTAVHLRGSVYIRYERSSEACAAAAGLHGRYYAGRPVSCVFVPLDSLRGASCGLYFRNACHKGGECNFIHPHPNPDGVYFSCQRTTSSDYNSHSSRRSRRSRSPGSSRSERSSNGRRPKSPDSRRSEKSNHSQRSRSPDSFRSKSLKSRRSGRSYRRSKSPDSFRSDRSNRQSRSPDSSRSDRSNKKRSKSPCSHRSIRSVKNRSVSPGCGQCRKSSRVHSKSPHRKKSKKSNSGHVSRASDESTSK